MQKNYTFIINKFCLILMLTFTLSCCKKSQENLQGLIFSDREGLQVISNNDSHTILNWESFGVLCDRVSLSPDGQEIAYSSTGQDVWVMNLNSNTSNVIISEGIRDEYADILRIAWSSSGRQLAVLVGEVYGNRPMPELVTLYVIEIDSQHIIEIDSGVAAFAWLPDAHSIVYLERYGEGPGGIYLSQTDLEENQLILEGLFAPYIAVSPEGDSLIVVAQQCNEYQNTLIQVNLEGVVIADLLADFDDSSRIESISWPVFSPDESQVAFLSCLSDSTSNLCSSTLLVTNVLERETQIVASEVYAPLVWSPNGTEIAFEQGSLERGIYRVTLRSISITEWVVVERCGDLLEWR